MMKIDRVLLWVALLVALALSGANHARLERTAERNVKLSESFREHFEASRDKFDSHVEMTELLLDRVVVLESSAGKEKIEAARAGATVAERLTEIERRVDALKRAMDLIPDMLAK
jgi:hypothetical protein